MSTPIYFYVTSQFLHLEEEPNPQASCILHRSENYYPTVSVISIVV